MAHYNHAHYNLRDNIPSQASIFTSESYIAFATRVIPQARRTHAFDRLDEDTAMYLGTMMCTTPLTRWAAAQHQLAF